MYNSVRKYKNSEVEFMKTILDLREGSYSDINIVSSNQKPMYMNVKEAGYFLCKPTYKVEREGLDDYLLVMTISGRGYLRYREMDYNLDPGSGFLIDCKEGHSYRTDKENLWEMVWIHFKGGFSSAYVEETHLQLGVVFRDTEFYMRDRILEIHQLIRIRDSRTNIFATNILVDLFTKLISEGQEAKKNVLPDIVIEARTYIDDHYSQSVCIGELSKNLGVSKSYLFRLFKKHLSQTPYDYLLHLRLNKAKMLLMHTEYGISEVARQVGFESDSHFINYFRGVEETTPLKYRKYWQS